MGGRLTVTSAATSDAGSRAGVLAVHPEPRIHLDRLGGTKAAPFGAQYSHSVEFFTTWSPPRAHLRFWPEPPATGRHSATFSLIGFTLAYGARAGCR